MSLKFKKKKKREHILQKELSRALSIPQGVPCIKGSIWYLLLIRTASSNFVVEPLEWVPGNQRSSPRSRTDPRNYATKMLHLIFPSVKQDFPPTPLLPMDEEFCFISKCKERISSTASCMQVSSTILAIINHFSRPKHKISLKRNVSSFTG